MDINRIVLKAMNNIFGLDEDELSSNLDLDLFETEILDSLGTVMLIGRIEELCGKKISIANMEMDDLRTVRRLTEAIEKEVQ